MSDTERVRAQAAAQIASAVDFAARMVRIPSMPGSEGEVAAVIKQEMEKLRYDDVQVDAAGNVIGLVRGTGGGKSLLFNGHMDHVSPGNRTHWHADPFSGHVADGQLWGRGTTDMKGPLACQVYAIPLLRAAELLPAGDVYVTAVVMEEIGGLGMQHLVTHLRADSAVVGEPSNCLLKRGHRGRTGLRVSIRGRAGHASVPDRAINPHMVAAAFLLSLRGLPMATHEDFTASTLAPTVYRTDNESINVIPESVEMHLDWRTVPGEDADDMIMALQDRLDSALLPGSHGSIAVEQDDMQSYSGLQMSLPSIFRPYALPADHWAVDRAQQALDTAPAGFWRFASDGGHLYDAEVPPLGFGPGLEEHCHIADERIAIAQMERALAGNALLALALTTP